MGYAIRGLDRGSLRTHYQQVKSKLRRNPYPGYSRAYRLLKAMFRHTTYLKVSDTFPYHYASTTMKIKLTFEEQDHRIQGEEMSLLVLCLRAERIDR